MYLWISERLGRTDPVQLPYKLTLAEGISSAPDIRAVYEAVLQALNEQE